MFQTGFFCRNQSTNSALLRELAILLEGGDNAAAAAAKEAEVVQWWRRRTFGLAEFVAGIRLYTKVFKKLKAKQHFLVPVLLLSFLWQFLQKSPPKNLNLQNCTM